MSTNAKVLRGQLRQLVKDVLPEVLTTEMQIELANRLAAQLKLIQADMQTQLNEMKTKQDDTLSFLVRQVTIAKKD